MGEIRIPRHSVSLTVGECQEADSYDTQAYEFRNEAEYTAINTLKTHEEAIKYHTRLCIERHMMFVIPQDKTMVITIHNRKIDVELT